MTDDHSEPGRIPDPGSGQAATPAGDDGTAPRRSPLDQLRGVGARPPGSAPPPVVTPRPLAAPVTAEPPPPAPAVIAVGDRPSGYQPDRGEPSPAVRDREARHRGTRPRKQGSFLKELPILLAIAVVLALLIKTFLVQAFFIPSGSMEQTLHIHDRVLVNKLSFHTGSPSRGEVVVFDTTGTLFNSPNSPDFVACPSSNGVVSAIRAAQRFVGIGTCGQDDFIKRIIAVPGDTIRCCTAQGQVILDGKPLAEPYLYEDGAPDGAGTDQPSQSSFPFCEATLLGVENNTGGYAPSASLCSSDPQPITVPPGMYWVMGDHRNDSEDSRYHGFVPRDKLVGRAFVRIWPPSRWGFLRVPSSFSHVGAVAVGAAGTPVLAAPALAVPLVGGRMLRRRRRRR